jgi:hypothetical protein
MTMNRRHFLNLSLAATLASGGHAMASTKKSGSPKKGLGIATKNPGWADRLRDLQCEWFYTWNSIIPEGKPEGSDFVPMIWGRPYQPEKVAQAAKAAKEAGIRELLGFNEPDKVNQSNMSVEKALELWPLLEETGMRLGSPGCVHPDREWMEEFMKGAKKRKLRVDFVCVHSYGGPGAKGLVNRLKKVHRMFRKPIWITEFAVGDWDAATPEENRHRPEAVLRFMEEVLPMLDRLDFVERYAWFPSTQDNSALGTSALFDAEGKLTKLGECYRDA